MNPPTQPPTPLFLNIRQHWSNNNVHLSHAHQCPECSHNTYQPKYDIRYTCTARSYQKQFTQSIIQKHTLTMTVRGRGAIWSITFPERLFKLFTYYPPPPPYLFFFCLVYPASFLSFRISLFLFYPFDFTNGQNLTLCHLLFSHNHKQIRP